MDVGAIGGVSGATGAGAAPENAAVGNISDAMDESAVAPVADGEAEGSIDGRGVAGIGSADPMETNMSSEDLVSLGQNKGTSSTDDIGWRFDMGEGGEDKELVDQIMKIMEIMLALKLLEETLKQLNESGGMGGEGGGSGAGDAGGMSGGSSGGAAAGGAL